MKQIKVTEVPFTDAVILPPADGLCPECAVGHEPSMPHNRDSLHYQYKFRQDEERAGREARWPTWLDAMAHCNDTMKAAWREQLESRGVNVDGDD